MSSIDCLLWNWVVSSWTLDDCDSCHYRWFAFTNLVCARAAWISFGICLFSFELAYLVELFSFGDVDCVCLLPTFRVGKMVQLCLFEGVGFCCLGFQVFPIGWNMLCWMMLMASTVVFACPVSFLLLEMVLYFLGFYYTRALFCKIQIALILVALISVTIAGSFFLITVFFLLFVSNVTVVGEWFVIVPSGIIFQSGLSVPRGSGALRAIVSLATFFCVSDCCGFFSECYHYFVWCYFYWRNVLTFSGFLLQVL